MDASEKPVIRFKGFSDEWEQHKLGECFSERVESFPDGELLSVTINGGVKRFCELGRNDNSNDDKSKYKKVCIGDIAYNSMRMWQGASGYSPYEGIVSPAYTVLSPNPGINSRCIAYQFKLPAILRAFQVNSQGITSDNWNLKYPSLSKIAVHISENEKEQRLIAKFFSHVDTFITIYQRKYEKLQALKASMLEKMFPKDGTDVPAIRVKGFTGTWERKCASELFTSYADKGHPELPVLSATQDAGMVVRDKIGKSVFHDAGNEIGYKRVIPGQFVIHLRSFQGGFAHSAIEGITSPAYTVFGFKEPEKHDDYYWKYVFISKSFIKRLETVTYGIRDGRSISYEEFLTLDFLFPQKEEQIKISTYLRNLDLLISLYQQELDKLQSIQKALLEKMFV